MKQLISVLVAAIFAAASMTALAQQDKKADDKTKTSQMDKKEKTKGAKTSSAKKPKKPKAQKTTKGESPKKAEEKK
jgi:Ni/Co efflux regulator RcnB